LHFQCACVFLAGSAVGQACDSSKERRQLTGRQLRIEMNYTKTGQTMGQTTASPLGETPEAAARTTRIAYDYFLLVELPNQLSKANERWPQELS